ncbi:protein MAIN-LIKE 1-like [Glycine max]|uniref:protein MAIN-LIKE 1-like n=1 Tax=Glycine max TaxID=3847 RepID=UPI0003DE73EC|nr:protein MAIN-LIKE 1-like [Glycine max]|eukprot:XP_006575902.1 protein MAIN-LIKE 1-like [Glycine max]
MRVVDVVSLHFRMCNASKELRQRVAITAEHDEPVVLVIEAVGALVEAVVYADEPMVGGDVHDTRADTPTNIGAQAAEDEPEGFLGGPSDLSMLTEYADHVADSVWTREERPELKLSSHGRKVHSLGRPVPAIEGLVVGTGLSPLIMCLVDTGDRGLLSLFVERWHRETSSFHLPMGEVMITLDNISSLLHLPVVGDLHAFQPLHVDDAVQMLVDLLMVFVEAARAETGQCHGPYIRLQWSATNVHVVFLEALRDLSQTGRYAWGVAVLCWIYEHFPSVAESTADPDYDEDSPRACRCIATKKIPDVCWIPYGEHRLVWDFHMISCYSNLLRWGPVAVYYRPERVMR